RKPAAERLAPGDGLRASNLRTLDETRTGSTMPIYRISRKEGGWSVLEMLRCRLRPSWSQARKLVQERRVLLGGEVCRDAARRVKAGQRVQIREAGQAAPPKKAGGPVICFVDKHLVVVDKPAGLTTMRHPEEAAEFGER